MEPVLHSWICILQLFSDIIQKIVQSPYLGLTKGQFCSYIGHKRKLYGWQVCEEGLCKLWRQPYHPRPQVECDAARVSMRGVRPHAPVNHIVFFLCHGFIKFMYISKILMKTSLYFFIVCVTMWTTLVPNSGSGFYLWVWILPVGLHCQWVWIWKPHGPELPAVSCNLHTTIAHTSCHIK